MAEHRRKGRRNKKLIAHDADFNMYAFFIARGINPDYFANIGYLEKTALHCAREEYYKEEVAKYKALFGK